MGITYVKLMPFARSKKEECMKRLKVAETDIHMRESRRMGA